MNFSSNDKYILVGSFMVIVFMSLVFPSLGLTSDGAEESNVPSLDINANTVDMIGERPRFPRSASSGEIYCYDGIPGGEQVFTVMDDGSVSSFVLTSCLNNYYVSLNVNDENEANEDRYYINESDFETQERIVLSEEDSEGNRWEVAATMMDVSGWDTDNHEHTILIEITDSPDDDGTFIESVPVIGGIFSSASAIASVVGWGISVFFWICGWFVELIINAIAVLAQSIIFGLDLVGYMMGNYNDMLSGVSGFASFILLTPVILLTVELLKLGFIFVKILPTT